MDRLAKLSRYATDYFQHATQHQTYRAAREWMESGVAAEEAGRWASAGYLPGEAAPLIAQGVTPEMACEMDQLASDVAGGPEERAAQVIDGLVDDGVLVDPSRVRQVQDPDDPMHIIVHVDE